jgi:hypothetical protein
VLETHGRAVRARAFNHCDVTNCNVTGHWYSPDLVGVPWGASH